MTSLSPSSGPVGPVVTINGTNFGATQGTSTITVQGHYGGADVMVGNAPAWSRYPRARRAGMSW